MGHQHNADGPPPPNRSNDARRSRRHSFKQVHTELKIAMGVKTPLEERAKDKRRSGGVPHSQTDAPVGMSELLQVAEGLLGTVVGKEGTRSRGGARGGSTSGALEELEQLAVASGGVAFAEDRFKAMAARRSSSAGAPQTAYESSGLLASGRQSHGRAKVQRAAAGAAGAAIVGLGVEYLESRSRRNGSANLGNYPTTSDQSPRRPPSPSSNSTPSSVRLAKPLGQPAPRQPLPKRRESTHIGSPRNKLRIVAGKTFLSQLSKSEHFLVQHAAATLLLRVPEVMQVVGSFNGMIQLLQMDDRSAAPYTDGRKS